MKKLRSEHIIEISIVFISFCVLFVSIFQTRVMKRQQDIMYEQYKTSVWPRLEITFMTSPEVFEINIANKGVGPAIVESFRVKFDDQVIRDWGEMKNLIGGDSIPIFDTYFSSVTQRVFTAGEISTVYHVQYEEYAPMILKNSQRLSFELSYKSIYGSTYLHKRSFKDGERVLETMEVDVCPIPVEEKFSK